MDTYTFQGRTGQQVVLDLRSQDFDPYLVFRGPEDESAENDDHEGDAHRSLLAMTLEADGDYRVGVTSYRSGETGRYVLRMDVGADGVGAGPVAGGSRREQGTLASGDRTLRSGEFVLIWKTWTTYSPGIPRRSEDDGDIDRSTGRDSFKDGCGRRRRERLKDCSSITSAERSDGGGEGLQKRIEIRGSERRELARWTRESNGPQRPDGADGSCRSCRSGWFRQQ